MLSARLALAAALALLLLIIAVTLLQSPMSVARTNMPAGIAEEPIASTDHSGTYCQPHEVLPRGTSAIRVWMDAAFGPRVRLVATGAGRSLVRGERGSGWSGGSVTIPVKPLARTFSDVTVCASFQLRDEAIIVQGNATPAPLAAKDGRRTLAGRMWIEYLRPGTSSWAVLIPSIMRRMGFGRPEPGSWVAVLALVLLTTVIALASSVAFKELP